MELTVRKTEKGWFLVDARTHENGAEFIAMAAMSPHVAGGIEAGAAALDAAHREHAEKITEGRG